jgi:hypothetical protein
MRFRAGRVAGRRPPVAALLFGLSLFMPLLALVSTWRRCR